MFTRSSDLLFTARLAVLCALALLTCALSACETGKTSSRDLQLVDVDTALASVQDSSGVLGLGKSHGAFIDPRIESEFRKAHIPNAVNLPFARLVSDHQRVLKDFNALVVYGEDFNDPLAEAMSKRLIELGYGNVLTLRGGLRAWKQSGQPLDPPVRE